MKKNVLILAGPTAVGKTATAIDLAKMLNCEIISADSMQIYKYMNIGTAKPTVDEQENIPHYLLDEIEPDEEFSVALFQERAKKLIKEITDRGKTPFIVGGTGLYVNSILYNMDFTQSESNWEFRKQLEEEARINGNEFLHNKLKQLAPEVAERIHPNNVKRVVRAIEVHSESGENIKDFSLDLTLNEDYNYILIGLTRDREELYERINQRVDIMIRDGLIDEVRGLLQKGYSEDLVAFKGLGYKEVIQFIKGSYSYEEMVDILKRDTRRYAKRQLTWFKRYDFIKWFNISTYPSHEKLIRDIENFIRGHLKDV
ncbi:tRNA (adenosine(37)-N6)-dimethylallyltransferase MiaA [Serpentinicella alkaliphila]|uniref:tRNA dimethylallyltransferase n=1 Tax=Serpentinicella alkaliphila TaxID=1734049 RepID=A0A4R2TL55_9FIRM|nr:tRNA (adenosine(37)-N6)-dimethylallyltransferase MiaA [Serpentinicella alkaliphila]QUH26498.1 tRNA (adenosine(37)-N6)-dimethylallyltransferase MiaA [Serpentinicella alkaliphila]TCQ03217.1 tRNA dimethylallyltransferase [Serpentinicella alkaliphila]